MNIHRIGQGLALVLSATAAAGSEIPSDRISRVGITLAPVFSDHAVLQRDKMVPIWGRASAGDNVTIEFHGQKALATAGPDGRWRAQIGPFPASSEPSDLDVTGSEKITLHDIVVGEVWLCSGQSNMEFVVDNGEGYRVDRAEAEVSGAHYPMIRQLKVQQTVATRPAEGVRTSGWQSASPSTVGQFTAVGYFFARDIHRALGVPVGIIDSPWGGTPVESWMSDDARDSTSIAGLLKTRWAKAKSEWPPERVARYPADMAAWQKAEANATATHIKNPLNWPQPPASDDSPALPGGLFNAMIAPLQPAAIRGVLWYQGEANAWDAGNYAELFAALIRSWRIGFGQGNLPFYFVQLANFGDEAERTNRDWARLREAQARVLALPATGMAVTIDIGDAHNIHPKNKQEVGRRLALIAKANVYGTAPETSGPVFSGASTEGNAVRVKFTHAGTELVARGGPAMALEVAGADRVFHPATGVIEVDQLVVSSPDVIHPVAVRYAWTNAPDANLYSDGGLPVVPFRSDDW